MYNGGGGGGVVKNGGCMVCFQGDAGERKKGCDAGAYKDGGRGGVRVGGVMMWWVGEERV